jgi:hypothetical protein
MEAILLTHELWRDKAIAVTTKQKSVVGSQNMNRKDSTIALQKTIKPERQTGREKERSKVGTKQPGNKISNGSNMFLPINNYFECRWIKFSKKKKDIDN